MPAPKFVSPKLLAGAAKRPIGPVVPNPALPNLAVVRPVGPWPAGAIVPKAVFPNGCAGHLELGVVVETDRPATHATHLAAMAAPPAGDLLVDNGRLRQQVADLTGQLAARAQALAERDARIDALLLDLAAAEDIIAGAKTADEMLAGEAERARLSAGPVPQTELTPGVAPLPGRLPVAPAPWGAA